MAVYAIGDVQGCYDELQALLQLIKFDPVNDQLWFAGDLVNRGPQSLEVLRFVKSLGKRAKVVLGNHDLHLLAFAHGLSPSKSAPDLHAILVAEDREELLDWLLHLPLLHHSKKLNYVMVHAGLSPAWDLATAKACAREVEAILQSPQRYALFAQMYDDTPRKWKAKRQGIKHWRYIINCFTRMRYCDLQGRLNLSLKGKPRKVDTQHEPWFRVPNRINHKERIIFGHWSTLGLLHENNVWSLDTGCVWGGSLTAIQLDHSNDASPRIFSLPCRAKKQPG